MASQRAYLPLLSSPVARKRYTSPTTAMVRPSVGVLSVGGCVLLIGNSVVACSLRGLRVKQRVFYLDGEKGPQTEA